MLKIAIVTGSTRPSRVNKQVADWVLSHVQKRKDAIFELVDIADQNLPLLDEPFPPMMANYQHEHTKRWSEKISSFDGYIFVTPEYNHATSAALKNAIDYLFYEWNNKVAGFVGYGSGGGIRAVENLRLVMGELMVADVKAQLSLSIFTDFENYAIFKPAETHLPMLTVMTDQIISWGTALKSIKTKTAK